MAIITKGGTPSKGSATAFTLNITDLLANSLVSNDAYFSIQSNWSKVFLNYISSIGGQKESVIFKAVDSGTSDVADFSVFSGARDVFEIDSIVILDKQGGTLKIPRADLTAAEFDVTFSANNGNPQTYQYFKFDFTQIATIDSSGGPSTLVGSTEIENDLGSGFVQMSGVSVSWAGASGSIADLYDGVTINNVLTDLVYSTPSNDIVINYGTPTEVSGFRFYGQINGIDGAGNHLYNYPTQIVILGSNDNVNFTPIETFNINQPTFVDNSAGTEIVTYGDWVLDIDGTSKYTDLIFS